MGATCLERHYTVLKPDESRDGPVSINPQMLKELSYFSKLDNEEQWKHINKIFPEWEITLGEESRYLSDEELLNRDYYRGRFINKVDNKEYFNWE